MKTTEYGIPGAVNEFGIPKPAKDVEFLHNPSAAMTGTRLPVSDSTIREMVQDFYQVHGRKPTILHLTDSRGHHRCRGIHVNPIGPVMLEFAYGAAEVHLE
jgi:hypothetical protein